MKNYIKIFASFIILLFALNSNAQTNTKYGDNAGQYLNSSSRGNAFFGYRAGYTTTDSRYNTFIGTSSGYKFSKGVDNVALGNSAGGDSTATTVGLLEGDNNVLIGAHTFDKISKTLSPYKSNDNVLLGAYNLFKTNITTSGNVAIGTYATKEYVNNSGKPFFILNNQAQISNPLLFGYFATNADRSDPNSTATAQSQLAINTAGLKPDFALSVNGPTFIGTFDAAGANSTIIGNDKRINFNLWVEKGVISEDFALASVKSWADFVFEKDYKLRPLSEVEKFINENKHLPDVPSAAELKENGASMATLMKKLTQKVEELTLYAIQQDKQIKALQSELDATKKSQKK